ncbi:MAG: DNA integrity scanning protein DisA nucleotide-binding domain protein [Bacilli bacterium]|nr:DNA integrity scanning protein DisA nucleotide-binding domain protein [Bacilli bacterium]
MNLGVLENWLALGIAVLLAIVCDFLLFVLLKRTFPRVFIVLCELGLIGCWLFDLWLPLICVAVIFLAGLVFFFIANRSETRYYSANNMLGKPNRGFSLFRKKSKAEVLFDREAIYGEIAEAVIAMSNQKVGAIIVLEKTDSLLQLCNTGTMVNAPVTAELLETIFYKGTRLHDGAVLIRDDQILAAAVALPSTNRALPGKYGMRHRAGIGISEKVDAVTVIVSEETGRISIAYQGELETVIPDDFLDRFKEYMAMNSVLEGAD